ncbi:MAG: DUF4349 domain-containing protein [Allomuricauda sp.]
MKRFSHKKFSKPVKILSLMFLVLLVFGMIHEYTEKAEQHPIQYQNNIVFMEESPIQLEKRNYASIKYKTINPTSSVYIDQKYEKIADVHTLSNQFDQDEMKVRDQILKVKGLIQYENKNGNNGYRKMDLVIGVPPKDFDNLFQGLTQIGKVHEKQITKTDKTNEYNELNAQKLSLEKIRNSLLDLKSKSGKISEYMLLENRILEIEQQLQQLGVSLGNFDDENEFCTIKFNLAEHSIIAIGHFQHFKNALEWTIITYLKLISILILISLLAYLLVIIIEKLKIIKS